MNTSHTVNALIPAVSASFKCLGSECPDNCCTGWKVPIDQATHLAYERSTHPELAPLFATRLIPQQAPSRQHYATIELRKEDDACAFLDGGLCKIQTHLGEDALSDTCSGYPRITAWHADLFQQGLTLSCPDAAHRILLQDGLTDFVQAEVAYREHQLHAIKDPNPSIAQATLGLRFFALRVMRQEHLPVWQRMAVLGFFCEEAVALQKKADFASCEALMDRYEEMLAGDTLHQTLAQIGSYPQVQVKMFAGILMSKLLKANTRHQKAVLGEFVDGVFGSRTSMTQEAFQAHMLQSYATGSRHLESVLADKPHFVANFLVNQMFNEGFPFNEPTLFDSYIRLVARFGTLRLLLVLRCAQSDKLPTPQQLADLTQVYVRNFEHDHAFKDAINQALYTAGFESMKYIVGILRD